MNGCLEASSKAHELDNFLHPHLAILTALGDAPVAQVRLSHVVKLSAHRVKSRVGTVLVKVEQVLVNGVKISVHPDPGV